MQSCSCIPWWLKLAPHQGLPSVSHSNHSHSFYNFQDLSGIRVRQRLPGQKLEGDAKWEHRDLSSKLDLVFFTQRRTFTSLQAMLAWWPAFHRRKDLHIDRNKLRGSALFIHKNLTQIRARVTILWFDSTDGRVRFTGILLILVLL